MNQKSESLQSPKLPSRYNKVRDLFQLDSFELYQAKNSTDGSPLLIKKINSDLTKGELSAIWKNEIKINQSLKGSKHCLSPSNDVDDQNDLLIYPDNKKKFLFNINTQHYNLNEFLDLFICVTNIVNDLHRIGIIHKSLNPYTLLFGKNEKQVDVMGFEFSSKFKAERLASLKYPSQYLPYISPEQTGRVAQKVDYRSDFYSIGVLFFELLTGKLPLEAEDTLGWIHAHIVQSPLVARQIDGDIPFTLSDIVSKLLAKNAEDRYQSAFGILEDLKLCHQDLVKTGNINPFKLGEFDFSPELKISSKIVGRELPIQRILNALGKTSEGGTRMVALSGYSGVGKSALVAETQKRISPGRVTWALGKFEQYKQDDTYSALIQALRGMVGACLNKSIQERDEFKEKILRVMGVNGKIISDLIPELDDLIGPQPEVSVLRPPETQNRFTKVFKDFVGVFASSERPLVLFLDDIQWSDLSSVTLVENLCLGREIDYLLLIFAYRENEMIREHSFFSALQEIKKSDRTTLIELKPLRQNEVNNIIASSLLSKPLGTTELSRVIFHKTQGNPFFVNELLKSFYDEELIYPSSEGGTWEWNLEAIHKKKISDSVVPFMVKELQKLSMNVQETLRHAACIGTVFDLDTLSIILERPLIYVENHIEKALRHGILRRVVDTYNHEPGKVIPEKALSYQFQHDRLQQAAYALIDKKDRGAVHLSIGRLLIRESYDLELETKITNIVRHLNIGRNLLTDRSEIVDLCLYNLSAGKRSKISAAYESGAQFLEMGIKLLPLNSWQHLYDLSCNLYREYAECLYLLREYHQAEAIYELLLEKSKTTLEKAETLRTLMGVYMMKAQVEKAIETGMAGLHILGIKLPKEPSRFSVLKNYSMLKLIIGNRKMESLLNLPLMTEKKYRIAMELLMDVSIPIYLSGQKNLFAIVSAKQVELSLKHGNARSSAFAYVSYGLVLNSDLREMDRGYEFGRLGVALNEKLGDFALKCRVLFTYTTFIHCWNNSWETLPPLYEEAINVGLQTGDFYFMTNSCSYLVEWNPRLSLQEAIEEGDKYLKIIADTKYPSALNRAKVLQQFRKNLRGLTESPSSLNDANFDELACVKQMESNHFSAGVAVYHIKKLQIYYLNGEFQKAYQEVERIEEICSALMSQPFMIEYGVFKFLTLITKYVDLGTKEQIKLKKQLHKELNSFSVWTDRQPASFSYLRSLLEAELYKIENEYQKALDKYDQAMKGNGFDGSKYYRALASNLAADLYLKLDRNTIAIMYLRESLTFYTEWGAHARVNYINNIYREYLKDSDSSDLPGKSEDHNLKSSADVEYLLNASQSFAREVLFDKLLEKVMSAMNDCSGAEKIALCLYDNSTQELLIEGVIESNNPSEIQCKVPAFWETVLSGSIIQSVVLKRESIVLGDACNESDYVGDIYITQNQVSSIYCTPLINQGELLGVIYFENRKLKNVFNPKTCNLLQVLTTHAGNSIQNVRLYAGLIDKNREVEEQKSKLRDEQIKGELYKGGFHLIEDQINQVIYFEAQERTVTAYFSRKKRYLLNLKISLVKEGLKVLNYQFIESPKSYIVNPNAVKQITRRKEQFQIIFKEEYKMENINISKKVARDLKKSRPILFVSTDNPGLRSTIR